MIKKNISKINISVPSFTKDGNISNINKDNDITVLNTENYNVNPIENEEEQNINTKIEINSQNIESINKLLEQMEDSESENDIVILKSALSALEKEQKRLMIAKEEQDTAAKEEYTKWTKKSLTYEDLAAIYDQYLNDYGRIYDVPNLANDMYDYYNPMWFCTYAEKLAEEEKINIEDVVDKQVIVPQYNFKEFYDYYSAMTMEEIKIYSYLFENEGRESAEQYFDQKQEELNQRIGYNKAEEEIDQLVHDDEGKVVDSLCNMLNVGADGLGDGINSFFRGLENAIINNRKITIDEYKIAYYLQYLQKNSDILDNVYQVGMATGNMMPSVTASFLISLIAPEVGTKVGKTLMGISAYGNAKHEALVNNYSLMTSIIYGLVSAGSEVLTENMGGVIGISNNASSSFIIRMLQEGSEEFVQSYIMAGMDAIILNKKINLDELNEEAINSFLIGAVVAGNLNLYSGALNLGINVVINGQQRNLSIQQITDIIEQKNADPNLKISDILQNEENIEKISLSNLFANFSTFNEAMKNICFKYFGKISQEITNNYSIFSEIDNIFSKIELSDELLNNKDIQAIINIYNDIKQLQLKLLNNKKPVNKSLLELAEENNMSTGEILVSEFLNNPQYASLNFNEFLEYLGINIETVNSHIESADLFGDETEYLIAMKEKYNVSNEKLNKPSAELDDNEMYKILKSYMSEEEKKHYLALKGIDNKLNPNSDVTPLVKKAIYSYTKYLGLIINPLLGKYNVPVGSIDFESIEQAQNYIAKIFEINENPNALPSSEGDITEILDDFISKANNSAAYEVTRGIDHIYDGNTEIDPTTLEIGDSFSVGNYSSSSLIPTQNYALYNNCNYMLQIIVPPYSQNARYIENLSGVNSYNQSEVLIARDAKMTVIDKSYTLDANNREILVIRVILN